MIEWHEEGVLLAARPHGETAAIVEVLTRRHGRHAGVVRGGQGRRLSPVLQPGTQLEVTWTARLEDHLGHFTVEPVRSRAAALMADRLALAGLGAVTALACFALPEREPHPALYDRTEQLLDLMSRTDAWPLAYLRWEAALLDDLGYGLDLTACAVTGATEGLAYVSPRTGRAVSAAGAGAWASRLLPLPDALRGQGPAPDAEILAGLTTTGHFLATRLAPALGDKPLPAARDRLIVALRRHAG